MQKKDYAPNEKKNSFEFYRVSCTLHTHTYTYIYRFAAA